MGKPILLVEDNPGDARLTQFMLHETPADHTARTARTAHIATAVHWVQTCSAAQDWLAARQPCAAVLLDLSLPDATGLQALLALLPHAADLPIVVLTGDSTATLGIDALNHGAQDYLVKGSFDGATLCRALAYATQRKQAEAMRVRSAALAAENAQLQETGRLKNQFLAHMSHELRTPLNAVIGFAQLLEVRLTRPDLLPLQAHATQIAHSGRQLLAMIQTMLDYAQSESGMLEFKVQPLDVRDEVQEVLALLRPQCKRRQVQITATVDPALHHVLLDPMRLRQMLAQLLDNAVKFSDLGGAVQLRVLAWGADQLRVEVQDHGIGIAASDLQRLFTPFQQLSVGSGRLYEGAGLGLALVRRLAQAQGGEVGVSSVLGAGSVFSFTLPLGSFAAVA